MQDWQQRVIDEKSALDERLTKLERFMEGEEFEQLSTKDRTLLDHQSYWMAGYSQVLGQRIRRFA